MIKRLVYFGLHPERWLADAIDIIQNEEGYEVIKVKKVSHFWNDESIWELEIKPKANK